MLHRDGGHQRDEGIFKNLVIFAQAVDWIPACAGMTEKVADGCLDPQSTTVGYAAALEQGPLHGAVVCEGKVRRLFAANARG